MAKIEASLVINRPVEEIFVFATDFDKIPQWMSELVEAKKTSAGPVGVGTTFIGVARFLGRRIENTLRITEYEANRKFGFKTTSGPTSTDEVWTLESVAEGTKITRVAEVESGGVFKLAEPVLARMIQRQWETNFANLKDLLEARAEGSA